MRYDDNIATVFYSPNGVRWIVSKDSPYIQWLNAIIKGMSKEREEEYVTR